MIPAKTFKAAAHYFNDSLTEAHRKRDIHEYNITAGLYHLTHALQTEIASLKAALMKIEESLPNRNRFQG